MTHNLQVKAASGPLTNLKDVLSSNVPLERHELLISYEPLSKEDVEKDIDPETHLMVAAFLRRVAKLKDVTYDTVTHLLVDNPVIMPDQDSARVKSDQFVFNGTRNKILENTARPSKKVVKEAIDWFSRTIGDGTVVKELAIDARFMERALLGASKHIDWMSVAIAGHDYKEKTVMDLAVLRIPSAESEYFQIYKIKLFAFMDATRDLHVLDDKHGLGVTFMSRKFVPRESIISMLEKETKEKAVKESIDFYLSTPPILKIVHERDDNDWPVVWTASGKLPSVLTVIKNSKEALEGFDMTREGDTPLKCSLAVAFDNTDEKMLKGMSKNAVVLTAGVLRTLRKISEPYDTDLQHELTNMLLAKPGDSVVRSDIISKEYVGGSLEGGESDDYLRGQIHYWFKRLVNDREISEDLTGLVKTGAMLKALRSAGKQLDVLKTIEGAHDYFKRDIVDLTVLRFPDNSREYFHLYELKIFAFSDLSRDKTVKVDTVGLLGEFLWYTFEPRESVVRMLGKQVIQKALNEGYSFFGVAGPQ